MTAKNKDKTTVILDAAAAVFAESGFDGARVDEIAARAGVNKAMLYYHIGDKQALYRQVLDRNFSLIRATLTAAVSSSDPAELRLRQFISALAGLIADNPEHPRIMLREFASGGAHIDDDLLQHLEPIVLTLASILGDKAPENVVLTHLSIVGSLLFLTSVRPIADRMLEGSHRATIDSLPREAEDLARQLGDLLINGLQLETA